MQYELVPSRKRLALVIATYNERANLPSLVRRILDLIPDAHILVVDDDSPDGTGQWVRDSAEHEPLLELLHRSRRDGLGTAAIAGLQHVLAQDYEWIATMDADFSHAPEDLAGMWELVRNDCGSPADVVIGSRYITGGSIVGWSCHRRLASKLTNLFSRVVLGLRPYDNSGALRLYRAGALKRVDLGTIHSRGFVYLEHLLIQLQRSGAVIHEYPITFHDRQAGRSKASLYESTRAIWEITRLAVTKKK